MKQLELQFREVEQDPCIYFYLREIKKQDGGMDGSNAEERVLRSALAAFMLMARGPGPRDCRRLLMIENLYCFLEFSIFEKYEGRMHNSITLFIKRGVKPYCDVGVIQSTLRSAAGNRNAAWELVEKIVSRQD